jgi:aspartyl/asparaginyl beta-hydroxylase (cupin superfamily)
MPSSEWSPRFKQALEIAAGRRKVYVQEPTDFHFPGLPAIQFFDPKQFSWASTIEAAAGDIGEELARELNSGADHFRAYLQGHSVSPEANNALFRKKDWSVLALCENGWVAPTIVGRFPRTWEAIRRTPLPGIFGWGPTVVFSKLAAGAHIAAHNGMFNTRLICHLPLIVPPGCRFRVGNEVREWEAGKLLIFDDTIEHEAWNDGDADRVVLIFDIWRPELTEDEKAELTALFHT